MARRLVSLFPKINAHRHLVLGLILASYVPLWLEQRRSLRLSQVIEMYYSNKGVSFNPAVRACNRLALYTNVVDRSTLASEALRFAHVLSLTQITVYIPLEELQRLTEAAVDAFMEYLRKFSSVCSLSAHLIVIDKRNVHLGKRYNIASHSTVK